MVVKPVVWSNQVAALGAAAVFGWLASIELRTSRTASRTAPTEPDGGETVVDTATGRIFDAAAVSGLLIGVGASVLVPEGTIRKRRTTFVSGMGLLIAAGALSASARRHLGRYHRNSLTIHRDQTVADTGPYRHVRHPLYVATIGASVGTGAVLGNRVSLFASSLPAAALAHRLVVEERMLERHLGAEYASYRARTSRLVPGIR